jgi:hypothetical protein
MKDQAAMRVVRGAAPRVNLKPMYKTLIENSKKIKTS